MKNVAFIGRDYFAARNLFLEMKRAAEARGLAFVADGKTTATLTIGDSMFTYFSAKTIRGMIGSKFDAVYCTVKLAPEELAIVKATLADSHGELIEGKPTLDAV